MISKITLGVIIASALLAGTITIGTSAYAQQSGGIPQTISDLEDQFAGIQDFLMGIGDDLDKLKNPERYLVTSNEMVLFEFGNLYHYRAQCNPGDHLVTGGVNSDHVTFSSQDHKILDSRPNLIDGVESWNVAAAIPDPNNSDKIFVKVLCEKAIP